MTSQIRHEVLIRYGGNPPTCTCPECGERRLWMLEIDHVFGDGAPHRAETRLRGDSLVRWLYEQPRLSDYSVLCRPCNLSKADGDACNRDHTEIQEHKQSVESTLPDEPVMIKKGRDVAGQSKALREKVTLNLLAINVEYLRALPEPMNAIVDHLITESRKSQINDMVADMIETSAEESIRPRRSLVLKYGSLPRRTPHQEGWWSRSNTS